MLPFAAVAEPDDDPRPAALALADRFEARAAALRAEADELVWKAGVLRGTVSEETARVEGLTIGHERSKVSSQMQPSAYAQHATKAGRPVDKVTGHPFARALSAHRPPLSVRQWAAAHKLSRAKVTSWMLDGDGGRRIPKKYADEIARDFKVPASAWANGIREE